MDGYELLGSLVRTVAWAGIGGYAVWIIRNGLAELPKRFKQLSLTNEGLRITLDEIKADVKELKGDIRRIHAATTMIERENEEWPEIEDWSNVEPILGRRPVKSSTDDKE